MLPSIHQRPTALGGPSGATSSGMDLRPLSTAWRGVPAGRGEVRLTPTGAAIPRLRVVLDALSSGPPLIVAAAFRWGGGSYRT